MRCLEGVADALWGWDRVGEGWGVTLDLVGDGGRAMGAGVDDVEVRKVQAVRVQGVWNRLASGKCVR